MGSRRIEMVWTCSRCGTTNRGRDKICTACGDPKDPDEAFEMPDPRAAATVTDPELLRKATAGRDWACDRCGANVSALHAACTQCGARRADPGASAALARTAASGGDNAGDADASGDRASRSVGARRLGAVAAACGLVVLGLGALFVYATRPTTLPVTVDRAHWERIVEVERFALRDREGFAESRPSDALDVRALGPRHHHDDQVLDHYETVHYTERVQDGYDQVSTTERVACGEDCVDLPASCHEDCVSDDNGFATCHETCSGGGRSCSTRYCDETRTRDEPRYRDVDRTRQDPVYRAVPVDAPYFTWRHWEWDHQRTVTAEGDGTEPAWPTDEAQALRVGLAPGEDERARRSERFEVRLAAEDGRTFPVEAADAAAFARFPLGSAHVVRIHRGRVEIDPPAD